MTKQVTVEAIQVELIGVGIILVPGVPENPPKWLTNEYVHMLDSRLFKIPNPHAEVFHYKQNVPHGKWYLVE